MAARHLELFAGGQDRRDTGIEPCLVSHALTIGAGGRKYATQRARAHDDDGQAWDLRDFPNVGDALLAFYDRPQHQLTFGIERPRIGPLAILGLGHFPIGGRETHASVRSCAALGGKAHGREPVRTSSALSTSCSITPT